MYTARATPVSQNYNKINNNNSKNFENRESESYLLKHDDRNANYNRRDDGHYYKPQQRQTRYAENYHDDDDVGRMPSFYAGGDGETATGANQNLWTKKCVDLDQIIRYFRTNDYSGFDSDTKMLVNTIRDICIDTSPLDVNVVKRFDSDESLMRNYERLVRENGGSRVPQNIFVDSFVDHVLPSYAQKFYNKGGLNVSADSKAEAARQLGLAVQYQVAQAVTSSIPIPLPFTQQLANNYMTLLLKQAQIPTNIQQAVQSRKYAQLNNINDLVNLVIDNIFAGGSDYYYYMLSDKNRARIISLKENLTYLGALSETTNIFEFIGEMATRRGKQPGLFREASNISNSTVLSKSKPNAVYQSSHMQKDEAWYKRSLTELAFQNEALRRFIFQQLSYKPNKQTTNSNVRSE
ncbi:gp41 [Euproctis pseudoconspersa nucleopolyhedrovirus]|uniref:Gp41 n=1 Tax=Euproctis pseudoconspersa nucleopolyhedrovirus TaxID=307467 RepID=C3TWX9_9ABAC|nr:gp41 [Euproctis pseudoconspersa nucleopolyhedrovirus]ACO53521.1 gp41 [Euproctis pseudoconspersa nucleopolyhedrovirus]QUJ09261.1 gp41 protein [Gynaephora ruoergensis nucleopolyhedrovirus]